MDTSLKKLVKSNGLTIAHNTAYGSLRGYTAAVSKGKGYIQITLSTSFSDAITLANFQDALYQKNFSREYRVLELKFYPRNIDIAISYHSTKEISRIEAFFNYFFPLLNEYQATRSNICTECGEKITEGCWEVLNGKAYHLHDECAEKLYREHASATQAKKEAVSGNLFVTTFNSLLSKHRGYQSN